MSKTIDERVVEMRFDNQQFEKNVQTSLDTLGKLKSGLDLNGAAKGLESIDASAKKLDFNPLANGVEAVKSKFSALEVIAETALMNITNSVMNTGKQMLNSLTIEPIKQGFDEYELKMGSIQTIMASTGASLEEVNGYLDELNVYADKTIYSFSDMTSSIGKFTNAGVDLKSAVKAIQGISNEAAVSGANSSEASRAMYNFAQALSSGAVKLIDWKSIENANMATVEFKQRLIDTAVALGTVVKAGDEYISTTTDAKGNTSDAFTATSMFNDSLSTCWMTTDVLVKTLGEYADETTEIGKKAFAAAQDVKTFTQLMDTLKEAVGSGWTETWEIVFGDFDEAKQMWTEISNVVGSFIDKQSKIRNELFQGWKDLGGRTAAIDAIKNALSGIMSVIKPIKEAFRDIFPATTSQQLFDTTEKVRDFTAKLKLSDEQAQKVKSAFKGLFSVVAAGIDVIKNVISTIAEFAQKFSSLGDHVLDAGAKFGEWVLKLRSHKKDTDDSAKSINSISDAIRKFAEKMRSGKKEVSNFDKSLDTNTIKISNFTNAIKGCVENIKKFIPKSRDAAKGTDTLEESVGKGTDKFAKFSEILTKMHDIAVKIGNGIVKVVSEIADAFNKLIEQKGVLGLIDIYNAINSAESLVNIRKTVKDFSDISNGISSVVEGFGNVLSSLSRTFNGITGMLDGVKGCLTAWQKDLKAGVLLKIAKAIAILAVSLVVIASIKEDKLAGALAGITAMFVELITTLSVFDKANFNFSGVSKTISMLIGLSSSILILASALKKISVLDWNELAKGLTGVLGLTAIIVGAAAALSKIEGKVMKGASSVVIFSEAICILAKACIKLSSLSWSELIKGLTGVGILLAEVDIFLKTTEFSNNAISTGLGIIELAAAIKILTSAAKTFADMNLKGLAKGLAGLGGLFTELAVFINVTGKAEHIISTGLAMIEFGAAMKIFASAVSDFAMMRWGDIARGLVGLGGALAEIVIALKVMPNNVLGIGVGLTVVGGALNIISGALSKMGGMTWGEVAKGLTSLGGSLTILAVALKALNGLNAGALTAAVGALIPLTAVLTMLGGMSLSDIGTGLLALAGAFTVLGIAVKLLDPLSGAMIKIAAAVTLFGLGCALSSVGILAISAALTALSASLVVTATSLGDILVTLFNSIAESHEALTKAIASIVKSVCNALKDTIPLIVDTAMTVLLETISSIRNNAPQIVDLIMDVLIDILDRLSLRIPELIVSAVNFLGSFMNGLNCTLNKKGCWEKLILSITAISGVFLALSATAKIISSIPILGALKGIAGFGIAVTGMTGVLAALGALAQIPGLNWLVSEGVVLFGLLGEAIGAFFGSLVNGLISNMPDDLSQVITACASIEVIAASVAPLGDILDKLDIKKTAKGMAGLAIIIGGLAAVLTALGGLAQIPGFKWVIGEGAVVLSAIGAAIGNFVGSLVDGLAVAVTSSLEKVISALASVGATVVALAALAKIVGKLKINPIAVAEGFAGVGVAIACIEAILAALGGLAQIPGFEWLIGEGGRALVQLGSVLGEVVGALISGIGVGLTSGLPKMGQDLANFATNITPFVEAAKNIDESVMSGVKSLAGAILCITAADLLSGITLFLTGGSSIAKFGKEIAEFGPSLKMFSDSVEGINPENVQAAAAAGKALAEMADTIPNEGGVAAWFAGENSMTNFGEDIVDFGQNLKQFSDNVAGINPENITAAAAAGKALAEMADTIPNEGGVAAWFAGDNSVAKFGDEITSFGKDLKTFSDNVAGINPQNVEAASAAGKALAEMAKNVPNEGGFAAWFAGENNVAKFGTDIVSFGSSLKQFSINVEGINPQNVKAAAEAGKNLAEMAANVPNEGGFAAWFAGENNVAKFGEDIASFGLSFKQFSNNVEGINPENVKAAAEAGKNLAEMAANVPNEGGFAAWFAGNNNVAKFGTDISDFGKDLKTFSDNVNGIVPENVKAASEAGKNLAEMADTIPNDGGVTAWFSGDNSLSKFGGEVASFGANLKLFSDNVAGIDIPAVQTASEAGKTLADMASVIPDSGGVAAWFSGDNSLAKFGGEVESFGANLKLFSDNVTGMDVPSVKAASEAGKILVDLTDTVTNSGGIAAWFSGEKSLSSFGTQIASFGTDIKAFSDNVTGLDVPTVKAAAEAGKTLVGMTNIIPDKVNTDNFGKAICDLSKSFIEFVNQMGYVDVSYSTTQVNNILEMIKNIQNANLGCLDSLANSLMKVAEDSVNKFVKAFSDSESKVKMAVTNLIKMTVDTVLGMKPDFNNAGTAIMLKLIEGVKLKEPDAKTAFINIITACLTVIKDKNLEFEAAGNTLMVKLIAGIKSKGTDAKTAFTNIITACLTIIKNKNSEFEIAGKTLMTKFIDGIKECSASVSEKFETVLSNSVKAIKDDYYDEFYDLGKYLVTGLSEGIKDYSYLVTSAVEDMASSAIYAAENELDINSPSKKFYRIGVYTVKGFANALSDYGYKSYNAGAELAHHAEDGMSKVISKIADVVNDDIEYQPTIRPVLDLSNVEAGADKLNAMFSRNQALSIGTGTDRQSGTNVQSGNVTPNGGDTFNFNQYNFSPKALSRVEIYRQTRNQFSAMERMMKT